MVDVGDKTLSERRALAEAWLQVGPQVMTALRDGSVPKGNALECARLAGIQAAKRTSELIPLCHQIALDHVDVQLELVDGDAAAGARVHILASARCRAATGVEMEALTATAVAGLTLIDMLKALQKDLRLDGLRLLRKSGGRSGEYRADGA
ncbi:MAG: cyclic pyranopterin monophosphate synthase MoaC [Pseudomonadota bacterium]